MRPTSFIIAMLLAALGVQAQYLQRVAPEEVGMSSGQLLRADDAIGRAIADREIPGAVLAVVRHGKMAYLKAYGNLRLEPHTEPMTTGTIFDMASCSKAMSTAVCTMILVEQGRIRLTDPVSHYIPAFKDWQSDDGKQQETIRIRHLLNHTSGLPPYAPAARLAEQYGSPAPQGLMAHIAECPRHFCPDTDFQYSCLNFITLQHIIEQVSGESLRTFARRHIFDVLGMKHTDYLPCRPDKDGRWVSLPEPDGIAPRCPADSIAPTERQPGGQILCGQVHDPLARMLNGGISGNAGVFSCANDIALLCAALQNGGEWNGRRILSPLGVKAMRTVPRATAAIGRTLGWDSFSAYASNMGDLFSPHTYSHTGYTGTSIVIDPDTDTSVILLINAVHPTDGKSVVRLRSLVSNAVAASIRPETAAEGTPMRRYHAHYYKRFLQFMDAPAITPKDLVMLGNSLTEGGGDWGKLLGKKRVVNRGIVGDEVMGVYDRLHQILPGKPRQICLMIGVNDVSHNLTADSIAAMIRLVAERIRRESPDTRLVLQSLLPINESFRRYRLLEGKTEVIPQINALLKAFAAQQRITYVDLFPHFCQEGTHILRPELTTDGLHLNSEGYRLWAKLLKKKL